MPACGSPHAMEQCMWNQDKKITRLASLTAHAGVCLMSVETVAVLVVSLLDLICILTVIFVERKSPSSTIAWVLVLILLPIGGFVAYLLFGSGFHITKRKAYVMKSAADGIYKNFISRFIIVRDDGSTTACSPVCARMVQYMTRDGGYYYTDDNAVDLYTGGEALFEAMMRDIRTATRHVHMLYYIFRNDDLGREIVALLTEKASQGVAVRVMYDSLGSLLATGRMFEPLREAGGEVEAFSPILATYSSHLRLNYRNHRKITVVDGRIGYVGGMNIGVEYLGKNPKLSPWRDTHLRLRGSSVSFLQERFILDWMYASESTLEADHLPRYFSKPEPAGTTGVQIVSSGPDTGASAIKNGLLEMLYAARRSVYIQTPYFTPDGSFHDALSIAALSGVDVRLMVPGLSDHLFVHSATLSYAKQLLGSGVKLYMYQGFLHAKTMVFDGEAASIGTANIGNRSFALNFEVNAFVYDKAFAALCERTFLDDQTHCMELTEAWFAGRSLFMRASFGVTRLFAPLI